LHDRVDAPDAPTTVVELREQERLAGEEENESVTSSESPEIGLIVTVEVPVAPA
jgi:hypothetical protein